MALFDLSDAFNDCVDRMIAGQSIDDCLRAHPAHAAELRSLLEIGQAVRRANPPVPSVARARVRARVMDAAGQMGIPRRSPWDVMARRLAAVGALIAVVVAAGLLALSIRDNDKGGLTTVPLATGSPTALPSATITLTPTLAATSTPTLTASATLTFTPAPSATPPPTATRRPSATPSLTPTLMPTPTITPTVCVPVRPSGWVEYRVQSGDTLAAIASVRGVPLDQLTEVNCLVNPDALVGGQMLYVPALSAPRPTLAPTDDHGGGDGGADQSNDNSSSGEDGGSSGGDSSGSNDNSGDGGEDHSGSGSGGGE
jgi:LysM repeat protein